MKSSVRTVVRVLPLFAALVGFLAVSCNRNRVRRGASLVGEEAAYAALRSSLAQAGVKSADQMVDAIRLAVDRKDYGGAAAAFAVALDKHNQKAGEKLTSAQVIALMRQAEPTVRRASPKVGDGLKSFCDYVLSYN